MPVEVVDSQIHHTTRASCVDGLLSTSKPTSSSTTLSKLHASLQHSRNLQELTNLGFDSLAFDGSYLHLKPVAQLAKDASIIQLPNGWEGRLSVVEEAVLAAAWGSDSVANIARVSGLAGNSVWHL